MKNEEITIRIHKFTKKELKICSINTTLAITILIFALLQRESKQKC